MPARGLEAAEEEFKAVSDRLYDSLLDLNVQPQQVAQLMSKATGLRNKVLSLYGVPVTPAADTARAAPSARPSSATARIAPARTPLTAARSPMVPQPPGRPPPMRQPTRAALPAYPAQQPPHKMARTKNTPMNGGRNRSAARPVGENEDWKGKLLQMVGRRDKLNLKKDTLHVEFEEVEEGSFLATLTSERLADVYQSVHLAATKQLANQEVHRAAVLAEFPGEGPLVFGGGNQNQGQKRTRDDDGPAVAGINKNENNKGRLGHCVQMMLTRSIQRGDIVYQAKEIGRGRFIATVELPTLYPDQAIEGTPAENQKAAEFNAAGAALAAFAADIEVAEMEYQERKALKQAEKEQQKFEKDAEKAALAEAGGEDGIEEEVVV